MSKLTEDDVRRLIVEFIEICGEDFTSDWIVINRFDFKEFYQSRLQATDKEPAEEIVNRLDRIDKTNKAIREKYGLPDLPKETADEGSRTPHATEEEVGVYSDVPPYE